LYQVTKIRFAENHWQPMRERFSGLPFKPLPAGNAERRNLLTDNRPGR
jgi:hypothetical protein